MVSFAVPIFQHIFMNNKRKYLISSVKTEIRYFLICHRFALAVKWCFFTAPLVKLLPFCEYDCLFLRVYHAIGGKPYQPQEQPPAEVRGDLNGDGAVTAADAVLLTKHLVGTAPLSNGRADLSGDAVINAVDLTLLKRILLTAGTK